MASCATAGVRVSTENAESALGGMTCSMSKTPGCSDNRTRSDTGTYASIRPLIASSALPLCALGDCTPLSVKKRTITSTLACVSICIHTGMDSTRPERLLAPDAPRAYSATNALSVEPNFGYLKNLVFPLAPTMRTPPASRGEGVAITETDGTLLPAELIATTRTVYAVPLLRSVRVQAVASPPVSVAGQVRSSESIAGVPGSAVTL